MKKINKIVIKKMLDSDPDTSFLGEYTSKLEPGVIVRETGEFYEKLPEGYDMPPIRRECRGFKWGTGILLASRLRLNC